MIDYNQKFALIQKNERLRVKDNLRKAESKNFNSIGNAMYPEYFINKIKNGIHPTRSGYILIILEPSWTAYNHKGAKHGSFYQYDSHIPLIFYGFNLTPKVVNRYVEISDIASTLSTLLHILPPSGNMGMPIVEVLDAVSKEKSKTNRQGK